VLDIQRGRTRQLLEFHCRFWPGLVGIDHISHAAITPLSPHNLSSPLVLVLVLALSPSDPLVIRVHVILNSSATPPSSASEIATAEAYEAYVCLGDRMEQDQ